MSFENYSDTRVPLVNRYLEDSLQKYRSTASQRFSLLVDAMQYSLASGGKRLRPLLCLASAECLGLPAESVLPAAAAVEYIHTYSLIHDDLPALDDDEVRRGKPASHVKFGEAVAILAGDVLLTEALNQMHALTEVGRFGPKEILDACHFLYQQAGLRGMVGGQLLDVTASEASQSLPEVEFIHIHKTGAMILASVLIPTKLTRVDEERLRRLRKYGETVGLAFQISDDILDSETSVRYSRGPRKKPKPSYTQLMSPVEMKEKLNSLIDIAVQALRPDGEKAQALVDIAEFIRGRKS